MFLRHTSTEVAEKASTRTSLQDDQFRYTARSRYAPVSRTSDVFPAVAAGLFVLLGILFNLGLLALAVWAIIFGIIDLNTVGFNGWAVAWIVIGGVGVLWLFSQK